MSYFHNQYIDMAYIHFLKYSMPQLLPMVFPIYCCVATIVKCMIMMLYLCPIIQ